MKEKKSINISTVLLFVAIIIIIILCTYIFILSKNNTSDGLNSSASLDYTNSISNTAITDTNVDINLKPSISKTNDTLPQLEGEFSDIKSITKEYRDTQNVKNYKDFEYDLDSDSTTDKITLKHIINENEDESSFDRDYYLLEYNGTAIYEHWIGTGSAGIVDLDNTDKYLDIWVYDDGFSDDPVYYFYRKIENKIIKIGEFNIDRSFMCDGKGKVLSADRNMPWVTPQVFNCYYKIENNVFKKHNLDFSYNPNYEYTSTDAFFTTNLENVKKLQQDTSVTDGNADSLITLGNKYNINKLDPNTKFKIIEFIENDTDEYSPIDLKVTLSDGTTGYLIHPYTRFYFYD